MPRRRKMWMCALFALALLSGCGSNKPSATPEKETIPTPVKANNSDPITLTMYMRHAIPEDFAKKYVVEPVKKKFPHITMNLIYNGKGATPADLVTAGTFPDLIWASTPWLGDFKELGLLNDLNDFVKNSKYDLTKLNQTAVNGIKQWQSKGELYALPLFMNYSALYYNKDLFDKFGVAYPKDGATWDETIELAKKLTRTEGGTNYKGLDVSPAFDTLSQLSLPYVDPKTDKALLDSEGFKGGFEFMKKVFSIPGNELEKDSKLRGRNGFLNGTTAMFPDWNIADILEDAAKGKSLNWDMVSLPSFNGLTGKGRQVDSHNLAISMTSKNKQAAFDVIAFLTSPEVQMEISKAGKLSSLVDQSLKDSYGANIAILKGKNIAAIFKTEPASLPPISNYWNLANIEMAKAFTKSIEQGVDINTTLSEANEMANKAIEAKKGKK